MGMNINGGYGMASWMLHLRVADKLLEHLPSIDETAFIVGNIAPDSGEPNEDWSKYYPPKNVSHFQIGRGTETVYDLVSFCKNYFNEELIKNYSLKEYSFFLGYYTHLLTDGFWVKTVFKKLADTYRDEYEADMGKLVWTAKGDWYDLDVLYLKEHPDFRAFSLYENAVGFENVYMDMFSKDAFENRRRYITEFYRSGNHGDLYRKYKYLTPKEADEFVESAVKWIEDKEKQYVK